MRSPKTGQRLKADLDSLAQPLRDELVRREQDKATQAMLMYTEKMFCFTQQMRNMTRVITGFTIFSVLLSLASLFISLKK